MDRCWVEKIIHDPPTALLPPLLILSLAYRVLAAAHRGFYRIGLLRAAVLPRPVISIGNLSAGGGGKTPIVMWLAQKMQSEGKRPAVLTRGYGRSGKHTRIAGPGDNWKTIGDEPSLIAARLTEVPVAVSPDRHRGGMEVLRNRDVDLFILDDGFGHHALEKDLEIVVIDDHRRFGNGRMLPAGILREPLVRLKDAGIVIVTKAASPEEGFEEEIGRHTKAPVLWSDYRPGCLVRAGKTWGAGKCPGGEGPFLGFCGIADPQSFRQSLERSGIETLEVLSFPDHHPYSSYDVSGILEKAAKLGARALVTTEKDAVRWPGGDDALPCFVLAMEVVFLEGEEHLLDAVNSVLFRVGKRAG